MSHCERCPMPHGDRCRGESMPRYCELIDPSHPKHDPRYVGVVRDLSRRDAGIAPTPAEMAASLGRSLWDWATSGFKVADEAEIERRLAICEACPEWIADRRRCRICGCYTDAKVRSKVERCPLPEPRW